MRRVLRRVARQHGASGARRFGCRLPKVGEDRAGRAGSTGAGEPGRGRQGRLFAQRLPCLPHDSGGIARRPGAEPHAFRQQHHNRRRHVSERLGAPRAVDRRRPGPEARVPDAPDAAAAHRRRDRGARGLSPEPEMSDATGLKSWLPTIDHKRIGLLYFWTAFAFFLIGGLEALVIRAQLAQPNGHVVSAETFNQLFTMHGTTMLFLALMPLSSAFFNYIIPLQIGARDVAFPRLNAFSYWVFLLGGLLLNASWFVGPLFHAGALSVAPDGGWFAYANLTERQFSPGPNIDFYQLGVQILGISSLAAGFNFIVTILNLRAPGMTMMRLPVFAWMTLVTQFIVITAFPVLTVVILLLMFDRLFRTHFFLAGAGATPLLWQHLFWIFRHPPLSILILPALAIVSELLPTFARKPLFGYTVIVYSGVLIGFMGCGVWSHHMFAVGLGPIADSAFAATTMLIAIPTALKIFNWIATLCGAAIPPPTPLPS